MGDETKLFRNKLKEKMPEFLFSQIESPKTAAGHPDTDYLLKKSSNNITGKIELKYEKTKPSKVGVRKNQYVWLRRYWRHGGVCFVALKVGSNFIYVWPGKYALELYKGHDIWNLKHFEFDLRKNGWSEFGDLLKRDRKKIDD